MAVTAAKSVMAFRVLTMAVDLCRLTTRTMNVNAGHERTSKARIIHQIQLIRGITIRTSKHYKFYSQKNIKKRSFHKLAVNLELFTAKSHHAISIFTTALRTRAGAPTAHSGLCTSPG
ncbi:glutamate decarboxylase isozyme [Shigella dysenteriae 1617]|nr:glutamate decarboxylase isozyme [Shigella dysenteriae 1617]